MQLRIQKISIFFLCLVFIPGGYARQAPSDTALSETLDKYVRAEAELDLFSGSILVARDGKIIYSGAYGYADKKNKTPNRISTRFSIGSVGKTFTAVLIMQLVEQGKLALSDTLDKYLPDFPYEEKSRIRIRHLLTHTSGLGNYFSHEDYESRIPVLRKIKDALTLVYDQKPLFEPGTKYRYSNSGMLVLGAVIEKVTGTSYSKYLKTHLLDPTGMKSSLICYPEDDIPNRAIGYSKTSEGEYRIETDHEFPAFSDGGLYSTAEDMLKYDVALRENRLLSSKSKDIMFTVSAPAENYALGWETGTFKGSKFVGHVGGCPGFAADFMRFPKERIMIIVLSNTTEGGTLLAAKLRHLVFGAQEDKIPLATKYDENFEKGRYLSEVNKDYKASIGYLDKNITGQEPHLPSLFCAARARIFGNIEVGKGLDLLRRYLKLNPRASRRTQSAVWWLAGRGYEQLQNKKKARESYQKSLEITPGFKQAEEALKQLSGKK